ncbi:AhpD family alkylhydroperoxidase [Pseudoduganella flava]|uniref:AhpD family alkylhydroperoxidase n=1 Tax=Pseudoduganella flava TaxID=871742 RepID=A0A562PNR1_9BURK|nr:carboxymuconolactone decarboxylase family protein [Pseudoduganella flava]QGZ40607.1 carboxymuconolactone decarboxylase family protein [Pseudoduganella flava]TWI46059.1 AhpD family alkylhydroperoxidase [Pseudoduganella flava]
MNRLFTQPAAQATGHAAELFGAIKGAIGVVPNAYAAIGSNSPVALEAALNLDAALRKSSLSARDIEVIKLAVSELAGCDYCLAAHTLAGRKAGLPADAMIQLRKGEATGDARVDALTALVRAIVGTRGTVPEEVVRAAQHAGISDAQLVDTLLAVTSITFTNLFNRVNDTVLDFPAAPRV